MGRYRVAEGTQVRHDGITYTAGQLVQAEALHAREWVARGWVQVLDEPQPAAPVEPLDGPAAVPLTPQAPAAAGARSALEPPPRSGPGSGIGEWRAFSMAVGVAQPEDVGRDEIITDLDRRGLL